MLSSLTGHARRCSSASKINSWIGSRMRKMNIRSGTDFQWTTSWLPRPLKSCKRRCSVTKRLCTSWQRWTIWSFVLRMLQLPSCSNSRKPRKNPTFVSHSPPSSSSPATRVSKKRNFLEWIRQDFRMMVLSNVWRRKSLRPRRRLIPKIGPLERFRVTSIFCFQNSREIHTSIKSSRPQIWSSTTKRLSSPRNEHEIF